MNTRFRCGSSLASRARVLLCRAVLIAAAIAGLSRETGAQTRVSAAYAITAETVNSGGGNSGSASYQVTGTTGNFGAVSTASAPAVLEKGGFAAQLYEVTNLTVGASSTNLDERQTRQLNLLATLDDATTLVPAGPGVGWNITGPIASISSGGLVTASSVYQSTSAQIQAGFLGRTASITLMVMNVGTDDFGLYAGDGLPDLWQVQYFGENNPNGAPQADPDHDGNNNAFEYAAGLVPTDPNSHFHLQITAVPGQPAQKNCSFGPCLSNRQYRIQFRQSLATDSWQPLANGVETNQGTEKSITDPNATSGSRFYRVEITYP